MQSRGTSALCDITKACVVLTHFFSSGSSIVKASNSPLNLYPPSQIVKILNSYTPIDDFEKRVSSSFVRKVQVRTVFFFSSLAMDFPDLNSFPFVTSLSALLLPAVFTAGPGRLHAADAGRRLSLPGHVSLLPVRPGSGAAAGPKQPQPDLFNQDMTSSCALPSSLLNLSPDGLAFFLFVDSLTDADVPVLNMHF